jgi:polar amino acid transport system substrate-binding protein
MKRWIIALGIGYMLLLFASCLKEENNPEELRIICEEFRPYSYFENNELVGISVDIVTHILNQTGSTDAPIEVTTNWEHAFEQTIASDDIVLFTTVLTSGRKEQLQWAGPVMVTTAGFTGLKTNPQEIKSVNDAKKLSSVGVVTGYSTAEILEDLDFTNLKYFNTVNEAIASLYGGSVDAVFELTQPARAIAAADGRDVNQLKVLYNHSTIQGYLAFSPGISSQTVDLWQEKLDELKIDGTAQTIYDAYLPGVKAPGLITIYTEDNPPQSYRDIHGNLTGSSVEMVEALMQETGREEPILLTNWNDAYNQGLLSPNTMVFSTLKSSQRESLFHWIGPVCTKNYCFFVVADSNIELNDINDAKILDRIGVPDGWASEQELTDAGFTNLQTWATPEEVFEKLMDGSVDAAVLNDIAIRYLAEKGGYNPEKTKNALILSSGDTYLAFSLDTRQHYLDEWQQAFTTIVNNGTFANIWNQWYPGLDLP